MRPLRNRLRDLTGPEHERGQSLVELALTLPVILLLTLIALDFGRVYLGYINLQNMTRIASNYAANHPDAWDPGNDGTDQTRYRNQILADATATNCRLPVSGGAPVVPTPTFTDGNGDGASKGLGDTVTVGLTCTFDVITPGISNILGGTVAVSAEADFPVKSGMSSIAVGGPGPVVGGPPNAAFTADSTVTPNSVTVIGPVVDVEFRDTSGGSPKSWSWNFADGGTSTAQDPLAHTFNCTFASCTWVVSMTATNMVGSTTAFMSVTVIGTSDVNFTSNTQSGPAPLTVNFSDTSTAGGTAFAWDFGDGNTGTGASPSHTYTASGTYAVELTVTYPSPVGDQSLVKTAYINVAVGNCTVPQLSGINMRFNNAQAAWTAAGFTGTVTRSSVAPSGNFLITSQSFVYPDLISCSNGVQVSGK
jgi:PKD repeat protein